MASIGGIASSSYGYVSGGSHSQRMFAKVDQDSSGTVDATELQGLLDKVAKKTGQTFDSADSLLQSMDSDGNGSLNSDELDKGMKSLFESQSTVAFAQNAGGGRAAGAPPGGPPPMGPPPADGGDGDGDDSSTSSTTSTAATDPLDTNGDGTVSAQERAAGAAQDMLQALMKAADTDNNGQLSSDEAASFKDRLTDALTSALTGTGASSGGGTPDERAAALASQVTALLTKTYGVASQ